MREKASAFRGSKCRYWISHPAIPQWLHTGQHSVNTKEKVPVMTKYTVPLITI